MEPGQLFINELHALLNKHGCSLTVANHWQGYAECGSDIRLTVEFINWSIPDIDLGSFIDSINHGGNHTK